MSFRPLPRTDVSRRGFLTAGSLLVAGGAERWLYADPVASTDAKISPLNRYPRLMQEYLGEKIAKAQVVGQARRAAITSKATAEAYVKTIRELIRDCFGPLPEKTPLNARVTRVVDRDAYRIENVIFESRPGLFVTANLYVPKAPGRRLPGVVGSCGHSANGKAAETYQAFAQGLARQGYVVLIFDPIGQGERLQYPDEMLRSKLGAGVDEHLMLGNQQFLVGEFFGTWRAWDGMRALDYLLTRDEVDPNHVGITGNSGGGTMTMWLCGLESRWTMAAPSCAVTTFRHNFDNELATDTEQCPPRALLHGLDHADFLAAMAPKPVIILAAEKDYFDVRGAIETYERLRPIYRWLGAEDKIQLFIGPNEHGYTQPNREAMYRFFNAQAGIETDGREPQLVTEPDEVLWCTPKGQVQLLGSRTVMSLTAARARELTAKREPLEADELRKRLDALIPARPENAPAYEVLRPLKNRQYPKPHSTHYAIETEPGIRAIVCRLSDRPHSARPPVGPGRVVLCVSHRSSDVELRDDPFVKQLIAEEAKSEFYMVDLRGIGDSQPDTCGENQYLVPYGSDYFHAAHSIMLGTPLPLQRAFDVLRVVDWLKSLGRTEIHLAAMGWGTIPTTLAAVVADFVDQVTLKGPLESFAKIAESELYDWPLSCFIPGVLSQFDLPDCYRSLSARRLTIVESERSSRK